MRYGAIPDNVLERLALWSGQVPTPGLDVLIPLIQARALMAGVELGVFDALREGPRTAAEVAAACGIDAVNGLFLLRALAQSGYVEQDGERFRLGALAERHLVAGAPADLQGFIRWNKHQWQMLAELEEVVRRGKGLDFHHTMDDPRLWADYQQGMADIARMQAPLVAPRVPVPKGARALLDLAGSHGFFAAELCRRHPPMRATVLDLPAAVDHARALAAKAGHADLVEHRAGDLLHDDYGRGPDGRGFDVIFLGNILHHFEPGDVATILGKALAALAAGGTLAIWEVDVPDPAGKAAIGDLAVLFFRLSSSARAYRGEDYAAMLREAGAERIAVERPMRLPGNVLVHARGA